MTAKTAPPHSDRPKTAEIACHASVCVRFTSTEGLTAAGVCVCVRTCRQCFLVGGADILREGGIAATSEYPLKNANKRVAMPFFYTSSSFPPPKLEPIYCRFRWHWFSKLTFPFSFRHPRRDVCTAQRGVPRKEKEERKIRADMADQVSG